MPLPFRALAPPEFAAAVHAYSWRRPVLRVDIHHTEVFDHADVAQSGMEDVLRGLLRQHLDRGLDDVAQHIAIAPDGMIWSGRDWNETPASVGYGMNANVFMIELVGDFDDGRDRLEGAQLEATLVAVDAVQRHFRLPTFSLLFHREVPQTDRTCPGASVSKAYILRRLADMRGRERGLSAPSGMVPNHAPRQRVLSRA